MEKGFKRYYKEGFKSSLMALKGFGIFKYQFLMLINLLGTILIIPSPIVSLVNVRVIKNTRITKKISITNSLQSFDHPISFWSLMISKIMTFVLFLGIVLLITLLTSILFSFGLMISSFINDTGLTAILFSVPGGLLLLAFIISIPYIYIPVKYVVDSNPQITFSKIMYNALYSLKQGGKRTVFLNALVFYSILVGIGGICSLIPALAFSFLSKELIGIAFLLVALMISVFIFVMPMFSLTYSIVKQNLYEDLLVDTYCGVKELTGINPKIMKKARKNGDIASLFDTIDYDDFIVEEDEEEAEDQLFIDDYLTSNSSNQMEEEIKTDQEEPKVLNEELLSDEKMENSNKESALEDSIDEVISKTSNEEKLEKSNEESALEDSIDEVMSMTSNEEKLEQSDEESAIEDSIDEVISKTSNEEKPKKSFKDILGKLKPKKKTKAIESEDLKENEEKLEKSNEESAIEDPFDKVISMTSNEEQLEKSNEELALEDSIDEVISMTSNEEEPKKKAKPIVKAEPKEDAKPIVKEEAKVEEKRPLTPEEKKARQLENLRKARLAREAAKAKENENMAEAKTEKPKESFKDNLGNLKPKKKDHEELSGEAIESPATKEPTTKGDIKEGPKTEDVPKDEASKEVKVEKETSIEDTKAETKEEVLFDDLQFEEYLSNLPEKNSKKVGE